jgi:hypothetical protein
MAWLLVSDKPAVTINYTVKISDGDGWCGTKSMNKTRSSESYWTGLTGSPTAVAAP